jgi:RNA recognition motif-containing protein
MDIYVGNIQYSVTETELYRIFKDYGQVENVTIIKDKNTGRSRGYGFVIMENSRDGHKAIKELNRYPINGRRLVVCYSKSNEDTACGDAYNNSYDEIITEPLDDGMVRIKYNN